MLKIFDCSNSEARPGHRGNGGPVENTIVRDLKSYAHIFECSFVKTAREADVCFTNDVFTKEALQSGLPLAKRMDGVFFQEGLLSRNRALNNAAVQADIVIFISEFSREAFKELYGSHLKKETVILNWANPTVFSFRHRLGGEPKKFIASATSWHRPEKRVDAILSLAKSKPNKQFYLIGDANGIEVPNNVTKLGYIEDEHEVAKWMHLCDAMICTAFRDAAPKTVAQGLSCGLPCFYAYSGGVPELVGNNGFCFGLYDDHKFYKSIPSVDVALMLKSFRAFCDVEFHVEPEPHRFHDVIAAYFNAIKSIV